jgi:hypothetical protein
MAMALSTLELSKTRAQDLACPHCGRSVDSPCRPSIVERGLSVLAGLVLALMLVPLAVIAWKSFTDFLSDKVSHSIFYHPLEDWTRY